MILFLCLAMFRLFQLLVTGSGHLNVIFSSKQHSFNIDFNTKGKKPQNQTKNKIRKILSPQKKPQTQKQKKIEMHLPQITTIGLHLQFKNISVTDYIY